MPTDLRDLQSRINAEQARAHKETVSDGKSLGMDKTGMTAGVELAAAVIAGTAIGYGLDAWLGTRPLFMICLFFLGVATGFYKVYLLTNNLGNKAGNSGLHTQQKDATKAPCSGSDSDKY